MQRLEVSGAVRPIYGSLGVKRLTNCNDIWGTVEMKSSTHQNPLVRQIGDYSMSDLQQQYKKYTHKRTKHILL